MFIPYDEKMAGWEVRFRADENPQGRLCLTTDAAKPAGGAMVATQLPLRPVISQSRNALCISGVHDADLATYLDLGTGISEVLSVTKNPRVVIQELRRRVEEVLGVRAETLPEGEDWIVLFDVYGEGGSKKLITSAERASTTGMRKPYVAQGAATLEIVGLHHTLLPQALSAAHNLPMSQPAEEIVQELRRRLDGIIGKYDI